MSDLASIDQACVAAIRLSQRENAMAEKILGKLRDCLKEKTGVTLGPENIWRIVNAIGPTVRDVIRATYGTSKSNA